jgi:glyoxylase-like metal-dependent hydrolase (beta-lactamase superfamily II)
MPMRTSEAAGLALGREDEAMRMESTMYAISSGVGALRRCRDVRGVRRVAGAVAGAAALLLAGAPHAYAQVPYANGTVSKSQQLDVRQSPYYEGYDFYKSNPDHGSYDDGQIHPWHVQGNVWLLAGEPDQSNVTLQVGNDGGLVVDTGDQQTAQKLKTVMERILQEYGGEQKSVQWIIDTDGAMDHIGGNAVIRLAGATIIGSNFQFDNPGLPPGATVIASQNVLARMVAPNAQGQPSVPQELWPIETHTEPTYSWDFNDEAVDLIQPASANTNGNEEVFFRRSDVIATGDIVSMLHYPVIDPTRGGSIDGELSALNNIIELATADFHMGPQEGGTMVIPGQGRLCDQADLIEYNIILTTIRNRIMYYKNQGKTLQQIMAMNQGAGPTWDFDRRWGRSDGDWNPGQFVRAVYDTLPARGKGKARFAMPAMAGG